MSDMRIAMKSDDEIIVEAIVGNLEACVLVEDLEQHLLARTASEREEILKNARFGPLGSDLLRQIWDQDKPLPLVVTAHLYFESFIEEIVRKKFPWSQTLFKRHDFTYSFKLDLLFAKRYLDDKLYNDLRLLGTLRNKFAHKLDFGLDEFDFTRFTYCRDIYQGSSWNWSEGHVHINLFLLRHLLQTLLMRLTKVHPFIGELKSPYASCINPVAGNADANDEEDIPF